MADFPVLKISYFAVAVLTMGLMIAGSCKSQADSVESLYLELNP